MAFSFALGLTMACRSEPTSEPTDTEQPVTEAVIEPAEALPPEEPLAPGGTTGAQPPTVREPGRAPQPLAPSTAPPARNRPAGQSSPSIAAAPERGGSPPRAASAGLAPTPEATPVARRARLIEIPRGTVLPLELTTNLSSKTSAVEDPVSARVVRDVDVNGQTIVPAGSRVAGRVTYAQESGKVKGVAGLTVRFHTLTVGGQSYDISAEPIRRQANATRGKDAQKIGIGAGAGAIVGGLLGGKKGAAIGAAAGGAGGTGVVLATSGQEVELASGTRVDTPLTSAVTVDLRDRN